MNIYRRTSVTCFKFPHCEGSYKVRGVLNQLHQFLQRLSQRQQRHQPSDGATAADGDASSRSSDEVAHNGVGLVTMSAGNYGKAFAYITAAVAKADGENDELVNGVSARTLIGRRLVVMPTSAPADRQTVIEV
jgi:hypothetical protein